MTTVRDFKACALQGRIDGQAQVRSVLDWMKCRHQFASDAHWKAYVTGFYRGAGFTGSGNRRQRRKRAAP